MTATVDAQAPVHIAPGKYQIMPPMTAEEFAELKADIKQNGVKIPIEFDTDGNVLDGHHRFEAFRQLISEGEDVAMFDKIERRFETEEAKWAHIIAVNVKRRHLTADQRQQLVLQLRRPPFNYKMQQIAGLVGASVATVWRDLDSAPEEVKQELQDLRITGADGIERTTSYAPRLFYTGETQLHRVNAELEGQKKAQAISDGTAPEPKATRYVVMAECQTEAEQADLLDRLMEEGYTVRALVL